MAEKIMRWTTPETGDALVDIVASLDDIIDNEYHAEAATANYSGKKATCNARVVDGRVVKEGEQIQLGGNESYVSLCRKHWAEGMLKE